LATEIVALDLDWDLVNHLAVPESVETLRAEQVTVDHIKGKIPPKVFEWQMRHVREHGTPATASVLEDQFDDIAIEEPLSQIDDLIERLRVRYVRNEGRKELEHIIEVAVAEPLNVAHELGRAHRKLVDMTAKRGDSMGTGDYDRAMREYDKLVTRGRGPSFGYEEVDNFLWGMHGLTFNVANPGHYKTWDGINSMACNIFEGLICEAYSLEIDVSEYDARLRCMVADVPWWRYYKGAMRQEDRDALREASELLDGSGVYRIHQPPPEKRTVEFMLTSALDRGADVVYIDQLQYVHTRRGRSIGRDNETGEYWEICDDLKQWTKEVPIWVNHQFNRTARYAEEMPDSSAIKSSAAIEETATIVFGKFASKDMWRSSLFEWGTIKERNVSRRSWEIQVEMNKGCGFTLLGEAEDAD
jgi:hypothetical protein